MSYTELNEDDLLLKNRYKIIKLIKTGKNSRIYLAFDTKENNNKYVSIK